MRGPVRIDAVHHHLAEPDLGQGPSDVVALVDRHKRVRSAWHVGKVCSGEEEADLLALHINVHRRTHLGLSETTSVGVSPSLLGLSWLFQLVLYGGKLLGRK